VRIEIVDLGTWGGAALLAEFDPERDCVAVNLRAVARVRAIFGETEARRFVACAVAHESFHRGHPGATEADAHAHAHAVCGADPLRYEAILKSLA